MNKAEEKANQKYPIHPYNILPKEGEHGEILNFDEWLEDFRVNIQSFSANKGYKQGYEEGAKDLFDFILEFAKYYAFKDNNVNISIFIHDFMNEARQFGV